MTPTEFLLNANNQRLICHLLRLLAEVPFYLWGGQNLRSAEDSYDVSNLDDEQTVVAFEVNWYRLFRVEQNLISGEFPF